jgi:hypothetical protein
MGKDIEGLGIPNLRDLNLCLLGSWVRRHALHDQKLQKPIVDIKYGASSPNIFCGECTGSSNFWKGVMWTA